MREREIRKRKGGKENLVRQQLLGDRIRQVGEGGRGRGRKVKRRVNIVSPLPASWGCICSWEWRTGAGETDQVETSG